MNENIKKLILSSPEWKSEPFTTFQILLYIWCNYDDLYGFSDDINNLAKEWIMPKTQVKEFLKSLLSKGANITGDGDIIHLTLDNPDDLLTFKVTEKTELPFDDERFELFWKMWLGYRKEMKFKKYTPKGLQRIFNELKTISKNNSEIACKMLFQSICKQWQGVFALRKDFENETRNTSLDNYKAELLRKIQS